jgi:hypothetical protein
MVERRLIELGNVMHFAAYAAVQETVAKHRLLVKNN